MQMRHEPSLVVGAHGRLQFGDEVDFGIDVGVGVRVA